MKKYFKIKTIKKKDTITEEEKDKYIYVNDKKVYLKIVYNL